MPLITGPAAEPVTLDQVKVHLRIDPDITADDALLTSLIPAARQEAEHRTGRRFGVQTWQRAYDAFPPWALMLPDPPVIDIVSIKYDDPAYAEQPLPPADDPAYAEQPLPPVELTMPPADYRLRPHSEPGVVLPVKAWPVALSEPGAVRVTYRCGIDATDARWESLRAWMLLLIGTWYAHREAAGSVQTYALPREFWMGLLDPLVFYGNIT